MIQVPAQSTQVYLQNNCDAIKSKEGAKEKIKDSLNKKKIESTINKQKKNRILFSRSEAGKANETLY